MAARNAPPLDRAMLDSAASPTRVFFGLLFLAWSWVSTVLIFGGFLVPALPGAALGFSGSYAVALTVAILVSVVEFIGAGRWPVAYWTILLALDAPFTAIQTHAWLAAMVQPYYEAPLTTGVEAALWIVGIICGIIAAIFGELLLFGRRR